MGQVKYHDREVGPFPSKRVAQEKARQIEREGGRGARVKKLGGQWWLDYTQTTLEAAVGEERVWVEAEKDPSGGIVLTLKDVRERRRLAKSRGQHAVKTTVDRVTNFPTHLTERLEKGYPIQFKMFQSAFESMLGGATLGGHELSEGDLGSHDLGSHYAPYRWIITRDYLYREGSGDRNDKGTEGPSNADSNLKTNRKHFVMKDDDGETYYEGDIYGDFDGFEPLNDFGLPNAGATEIWYGGKML